MFANALWIRIGLSVAVCLNGYLCLGNELLDEVKEELVSAESRLATCSLQARYRILAIRNEKEVRLTATFSMFQGRFFSETISDPKTGLETVRASNDKYIFVVTRQKDSDQYALLEIHPRSAGDKEMQLSIDAGNAGVRMRLFNSYTINATWPAGDLVRDPGFRILSAERVTQKGQSYIKIAYDAKPETAQSEVATTEPFVGYFICDPALNWAITEQWLKATEADSHGSLRLVVPKQTDCDLAMSARYLTAYVAESEIDAARGRVSSSAASNPALQQELLEILEPPNESQFFLSHYGLKEPQLRGFLGPWVWYLLGSVVLAIAAGVFYRRWR